MSSEPSKGLKRARSVNEQDRHLLRIRARRRFKMAVRLVIANLFWLEDVEDEESLGEDFRKNVTFLLKKKKDKKGLLTLKDKLILNKPANIRTEEEKQHLSRIIGGLKCFRKYPDDIKHELAAVSYFVYYPPGRVIVKQFRDGQALYFIMSGEVSVSVTVFDPVFNENKTVVVGTMVSGQMFGEVSLLHDIPRTATITTITHCELVCLMKHDFNVVLKSSLQEVWDEVLRAMARFNYFDGWDDVSMRECCIYSRIKLYTQGDVVYGDGGQSDSFVHFVLKGQCRCIEQLPIVETVIGGFSYFKLFDRAVYKQELELKKMRTIAESTRLKAESRFDQESMREKTPMVYKVSTSRRQSVAFRRTRDDSRRSSCARRASMKPDADVSGSYSTFSEYSEAPQDENINTDDLKKLLGIFEEEEEELTLPPYVKIVFMQVCLYNELACFGLGEEMKYREIVAATDCECLLIPKFWIWSKNKGNLWTRVKHTLNRQIPTTEDVFFSFVENRNWGRAKRELINSLTRKPPCNVPNNVPYSIRLDEDIDYGIGYRLVSCRK